MISLNAALLNTLRYVYNTPEHRNMRMGVASFPSSPLVPTKNKNGVRGEILGTRLVWEGVAHSYCNQFRDHVTRIIVLRWHQ